MAQGTGGEANKPAPPSLIWVLLQGGMLAFLGYQFLSGGKKKDISKRDLAEGETVPSPSGPGRDRESPPSVLSMLTGGVDPTKMKFRSSQMVGPLLDEYDADRAASLSRLGGVKGIGSLWRAGQEELDVYVFLSATPEVPRGNDFASIPSKHENFPGTADLARAFGLPDTVIGRYQREVPRVSWEGAFQSSHSGGMAAATLGMGEVPRGDDKASTSFSLLGAAWSCISAAYRWSAYGLGIMEAENNSSSGRTSSEGDKGDTGEQVDAIPPWDGLAKAASSPSWEVAWAQQRLLLDEHDGVLPGAGASGKQYPGDSTLYSAGSEEEEEEEWVVLASEEARETGQSPASGPGAEGGTGSATEEEEGEEEGTGAVLIFARRGLRFTTALALGVEEDEEEAGEQGGSSDRAGVSNAGRVRVGLGSHQATATINVTIPAALARGNVTVFAHVVATRAGSTPDPSATGYRPADCSRGVSPVIVFHPKRKESKLRSLVTGIGGDEDEGGANGEGGDAGERVLPRFGIGIQASYDADEGDEYARHAQGGSEMEEGEEEEAPVLPYWRPHLHVAMVQDETPVPVGGKGFVQPPYGEWIRAEKPMVKHTVWKRVPRGVKGGAGSAPSTKTRKGVAAGERPGYVRATVEREGAPGYVPVTYVNHFWGLMEDWIEVNRTVTHAPLELRLEVQSSWYWLMLSQAEASMSMQQQMGTQRKQDGDILKAMLLEANPILLAVFGTVSLLHMVFEFAAFSSDVSFWRNAKSVEGLSMKQIAMNVFFQGVILLYLWDNDTSWMVLGSSAVGLAIEVWKLRRAFEVSVEWKQGSLLPSITWEDQEEYAKSRAKEFDDMAMSHLGFVAFPLVVGYACYSLLYDQHKSYYSWVLSSLTGFVYAFGFILMTPQLFINYKLKSVAHMPWKAMVYRSLNTVVDDLFAFVIRMPTLHRIACFRDDVVFLLFLWQRYLYPVDPNRANEYGMSGADYEAMEAKKLGKLRVCKRPKTQRVDLKQLPGAG